jgi:16S rRNA processing protein RimM
MDINAPEPSYITIGEVLNSFGYEGELKVRILTDFLQRFQPGARVYIDGIAYTIEKSHPQKAGLVLKLTGVNTLQEVNALRHKLVEIPEIEKMPLPAGKYYYADIIGLEVWTTQGELVGTVSEIINTGCNDVYVVSNHGEEVLVPAVKNVVQVVDLKNKRLIIEAIEGLLG